MRSGDTWPTAASAAVMSMRSPASTEETRPLRSQARAVRALAVMRGDVRIASREVRERVDICPIMRDESQS